MTERKNKWFAYLYPVSICLLLHSTATAQIHVPYYPDNTGYDLMAEQYAAEHYRLSAQSVHNYLAAPASITNPRLGSDIDRARYFSALTSLKLVIPGCEDSARDLIAYSPNATHRERTAYMLAQHYFRQNRLHEAVSYYEIAGIANLSNPEIVHAKFEMAYCYFNNKQFNKAEPLFASIKELTEGKYFAAGNYYYGLLAYNENNYPQALQSFNRIKDDKQYRNIVPYYIAEIYYFAGDREKALNEAKMLMKRPEKLYYDNELHLLAAQCLFEAQNFSEALPYFEHYYQNAQKVRKEDLYEMSYCYYRLKQWPQATEKFKLLSNTEDSLGQTAMYLLGDCYLKTDDKQSARNAFGLCADMAFNPGQQEAAMMLYSKLSYEMGYYDPAAQQLNNLLAAYPSSPYRDEAKTLLSDLLVRTSNYEAAITLLQDVNTRNRQYKEVYQKVTYGYAMQQYQKGDIAATDSLLGESLKSATNDNYEAAAWFWKAELAYQQHRYADAIQYGQSFLSKNIHETEVQYISSTATAQHAYVTMGYAAMAQEQYTTAQSYFAHAQQGRDVDSTVGMVAILREADAVFMQKNYAAAATLYDKVIAANGSDAAYARYQKGILLGLQGKVNDKVTLLQSLVDQTPPSAYADMARYELALTFIGEDKYPAAITMLQPLTVTNNPIAPKAWMRTAFALQQMNSDEKAIASYKRVVTDYPTSDERQAALDALRSLYIETNQPSAYARLLRETNIPAADSGNLDATYYAAAEAQYASGKWDKARDAMGQYLQQYPNGAFVIKAHYYRAESNYQLKNNKDAVADYNAVLQSPWSEFAENSARRAATIAYQDGKYSDAFDYYQRLRNTAMNNENLLVAYNGMMKSSFNTKKYNDAAQYADTLLSLPGVAEASQQDALLYKAKALQEFNKGEDAINVYRQLESSKNSTIAAEARYHIAEIHYQDNNLKEAEAAANATIRQSGGNDYWIQRSYMLLADILTKQKDYFNAKATLQSIVKNTKIAEVKQEATKKLERVKTLEKQNSKLEE